MPDIPTKLIVSNRKARHEYHVLGTEVAELVLRAMARGWIDLYVLRPTRPRDSRRSAVR